jgi:hypothetical protein
VSTSRPKEGNRGVAEGQVDGAEREEERRQKRKVEERLEEDKEKEMKKLEFGNKMEDTWIVEVGVLERRNHKTVANA